MASVAPASPPETSADVPRSDSRKGPSAALQSSVLALNRNFMAVQVISAKRAFCLLFKGQAEVVNVEGSQYCSYDFEGWLELSQMKLSVGDREDHEDWIQAVNFQIQVPRVIRLTCYDQLPRASVKFNRRNIFLRDGHRCQYCGKRYSSPRLSLDHVLPKSRGGGETWENIVCACLKCNVAKGGRTPAEAGMKLLNKPTKPKRSPLLNRQLSLRKYECWQYFIPQSAD